MPGFSGSLCQKTHSASFIRLSKPSSELQADIQQNTHSPARHCAGSLKLFSVTSFPEPGLGRAGHDQQKKSAPVGPSSNSQYFRCRGKRLLPEDRSGGLAGLGLSESKLKRSLPVRRICSSSFLCRFMSERTLSRRASRFWLRAELPKKVGSETGLRQRAPPAPTLRDLVEHIHFRPQHRGANASGWATHRMTDM